MKLEEEVYNKVQGLCNKAEKYVRMCEFDQAIQEYEQALNLFPQDIKVYEQATIIYAAMGDAWCSAGEYKDAKKYFYDALNCSGGIGNPYILFRLGQCLYECNQKSKAQEYFIKTYMLDGISLFNTSHNKYFNTIKEMVTE
ncbi:tetratricopeptide repeat protein [Clostridium estertheticum]|uniref:tetratricopeptide repeat protein n=1 Tax=Clostridium estertheticum TaxID=238834 RepID=UPI001CF143C9|nr:tetratricopeptide repeat protein [Clostridium estertheticum]MCB2355765.1 tetratricopeptide repeat protein [Clostridium estertheticum]WAG39351.1 tetratricopeptide repeat protein [Clostridium estertheticum]